LFLRVSSAVVSYQFRIIAVVIGDGRRRATFGYYRNIQRLAEKPERWISALIGESESDTEQRDGVIIGDVRTSRPRRNVPPDKIDRLIAMAQRLVINVRRNEERASILIVVQTGQVSQSSSASAMTVAGGELEGTGFNRFLAVSLTRRRLSRGTYATTASGF